MYKQEIIDKVNAVMSEKSGIDAGYIEPDDFYDELGIDEGKFAEVLLEIEDAFAISIPSEKLLHVSTMQHVYDLVGETIVATHGFQLL